VGVVGVCRINRYLVIIGGLGAVGDIILIDEVDVWCEVGESGTNKRGTSGTGVGVDCEHVCHAIIEAVLLA
jgi:hypothetical protein